MIFIRVDMNSQIATGHLMRCLSIAEAICIQGENVTFVLADEQAVEILNEKNLPYIILHTQWNDLDSELPKLKEIIRQYNISKLFIDSYQVTYRYLLEVSQLTKTIYIDDLGSFEYPVDMIVCYANYWKNLGYDLKNKNIKYLLGMDYIPLRKAFWNMPPKNISANLERLLILSGGSDPYNILQIILDGIEKSNFKRIDVICGKYNANYEDLKKKYECNSKVNIKANINNLEEYMMKADVAISAGGTTLYELCACGTPTISYTFVDNQIENARQFDQDGLIEYVGDVRFDDIMEGINVNIKEFKKDSSKRKKVSHQMKNVVDGKGAIRLAGEIVDM